MQKYEREIEELLERLETEEGNAPPRPLRRDRPPQLPRRRRTPVLSALGNALSRYTPNSGQLMAAGFGLVVLAWLLPLPGVIDGWVKILGVILFLGAILVGLLGGGRGRRSLYEEKTWRGRSVEPERESWDDIKARMADSTYSIRRWFRRR
ncbi:MAG: hypothetical protein H0V86_12040 [Chloroflexia bacterium]|nr:hypothetical protein [Chloroflexia bacterium]